MRLRCHRSDSFSSSLSRQYTFPSFDLPIVCALCFDSKSRLNSSKPPPPALTSALLHPLLRLPAPHLLLRLLLSLSQSPASPSILIIIKLIITLSHRHHLPVDRRSRTTSCSSSSVVVSPRRAPFGCFTITISSSSRSRSAAV